jgi:PBP1b-binding outer membrane lipoprotein LpoB
MLSRLKIAAALAAAVLVAGCASSATEQDFRRSVDNIIAKQSVGAGGPLADDEPIDGSDGRRLEAVDAMYRTKVGDSAPVVRQVRVTEGEK